MPTNKIHKKPQTDHDAPVDQMRFDLRFPQTGRGCRCNSKVIILFLLAAPSAEETRCLQEPVWLWVKVNTRVYDPATFSSTLEQKAPLWSWSLHMIQYKPLSNALCASSEIPEQGYSANMYCKLYLCMSHLSYPGNSDSFPAIKLAWFYPLRRE